MIHAHVEQALAPTLKPGAVATIYNLPARKPGGVPATMQRVGATLLYRQPCSPDFNPIEWARRRLLMGGAGTATPSHRPAGPR